MTINTMIVVARTISRHYGYEATIDPIDENYVLVNLCDYDEEGWIDWPDEAVVQMIVNELNARFGQFAKFGITKETCPGENYIECSGLYVALYGANAKLRELPAVEFTYVCEDELGELDYCTRCDALYALRTGRRVIVEMSTRNLNLIQLPYIDGFKREWPISMPWAPTSDYGFQAVEDEDLPF